VIAVYLGALVVALGVFGVQTFGGHDADATGHDLTHGDHDAPPWALLASLRFWSFALLAFGLTGALLTFFGLAGAVAAGIVSGVAGVLSGAFATTVIRRMTNKGPSSLVQPKEVVGKVGRVLVPTDGASRGKVRVEVKGKLVDYVAASSEPLAQDDVVVVEDYDDGQIVVSKAPKELK
jgi:membrane protein implicated in regulation of membrane protease activity